MADQFQTYDKSPIIGNTFAFRAWRFGFREAILGAVAVLLLVLCFVFAGLFGDSSVKLQEAEASASRAGNVCKNSPCLRTAGYLMELLNVSANPCDNFLRFACGGYEEKNPVDSSRAVHQSVIRRLFQENQDRLMTILEGPVERFESWSSERKLKDFFTSCTDDFRREQLKARPLFSKVFPLLGGWYVMNSTWSATRWELNGPLMVLQTDLWIDALFAPRPMVDEFDSKKRVIVVGFGWSLGL